MESIQEKLREWYALDRELSSLKEKERVLRAEIVAAIIGDVEGSKSHKDIIGNGYVVKTGCKYSRKLDKAGIEQYREKLAEIGVDVDGLIKRKVIEELELKAYRSLTTEQAAMFNNCLIVSDPAYTLEIVKPE